MKRGLNKVIKAHIAFEHQENNTFVNRRVILALLKHNLNLESVEEFSDETDIICIGRRQAIYDFIEEMLSAELPLMLIKFIEAD